MQIKQEEIEQSCQSIKNKNKNQSTNKTVCDLTLSEDDSIAAEVDEDISILTASVKLSKEEKAR